MPFDVAKTARRIGGTDISCLLGLNKYRDALDVYERIVLGRDEPPNERMLRGLREEPRIRAMFVERMGIELEPHPGVIRHPEHEFATVSPDDFATIERVPSCCEYKSVSVWAAKAYGDDGTDAAPDDYACQVHWSMAVANRPQAFLFAAFGEDVTPEQFDVKFTRLYRFQRDADIERRLLKAGEFFWNQHVLPMVPPKRTRKPTPKKRSKKQEAAP